MDATWMDGCAQRSRWASRARALFALCVGALLLWAGEGAAWAQAQMIARAPEGGGEVPLPLIEESARVEIDQQHATTTVRYVFENRTGRRVEGHFAFRAGEGANVDGFAYWNGAQKIVGEVMETGVARSIYSGTVQRRRDPGLLEKTGDGSFSLKIFPIEPGERKRIEIKLDQWLPRRDRAIDYRLPLTREAAEIDVVVRDDRRIRRVRSASHDVAVTGSGTAEARVRIGPARHWLFAQQELALRYELDDRAFQLHAHAHRDRDQQGYVLVTLAAPPLDEPLSQDLTLVIDATAPMFGEPLESARLAAKRIIARLRASDRFNVVVLEDEPRRLYSAPRWATKAARDEAIAMLGAIRQGGRGDLAQALASALTAQDGGPRNKTIALLTDGRSGATRALPVAEVDRTDVRLFTVGFGPNVDRAALTRLAGLKRGRFTLIESGDAIASRADRLSQWIAAPILRHVSLEVNGAAVRETYPRVLPDLYPGQELKILGRIEAMSGAPARVVVRGRGSESFSFTTSLDVGREARRPWIGKLWAKERVDHLLGEIAARGAQAPLVAETTELALAYNIVTPYTAFLAIPESELTSAGAADLASARMRKQAILALNPDAAAVGGNAPAGAPAYAHDSIAAPVPPMPMSPSDRPAPAPEGMAEARVRGGGCAGCEIGGEQRGEGALAWALAAVGLVALRRSRRR